MAKTDDGGLEKQGKELKQSEEKQLRFLLSSYKELEGLLEQVKEAEEGKEEVSSILKNLRRGRFGGLVKGEEKIERRIASNFHQLMGVAQSLTNVFDDTELKLMGRLEVFDADLVRLCSRGGELETALRAAKKDLSHLQEAKSLIKTALTAVRDYEVELNKLMKENEIKINRRIEENKTMEKKLQDKILALKGWYFTTEQLRMIHYLSMRFVLEFKEKLKALRDSKRSTQTYPSATREEIESLLRSDEFYHINLEVIMKQFEPARAKQYFKKFNTALAIAYYILNWLKQISTGDGGLVQVKRKPFKTWSGEVERYFIYAIQPRVKLGDTVSSRKEVYEKLISLCEDTLIILEKEGERSNIKLKRAKNLDELFDDIYSS